MTENVTVGPLALTMIALHAASYSTSECHGILIGSFQDSKFKVTDAFPVCHENPTKPVIESALALALSKIQSDSSDSSVIGWYNVPEMAKSVKPEAGPLRIAASIDGGAGKAVLVIVSKASLGELLSDKDSSLGDHFLSAFGKDFGKQWKEKLQASFSSEECALKAVRALADDKMVFDLVDHWLTPSSGEWPRDAFLQQRIMEYLG